MADDDFIVPPAWLASTPAPAQAAPPASEDAPDVITLPPGMADSATHRLPPERQRTPPPKPEVSFFPGALGAPVPSAPPPPPAAATPTAPPPPPAASQAFPPPSTPTQGFFPPPAAPQRPVTAPAAPQQSFPPPAAPVGYSTPSAPPPPPAAPAYAPPAYDPPPAPLTQAPAPPAPPVAQRPVAPTPPPAPVAASTTPLAPVAAPAPRWSLALENGLTVPVTGAVYLGRNPSAGAEHPSAATLTIDDPRKSISKTHALLVVDAGGAWLTDLHSTNGCAILGDDGSELVLTPGVALAVAAGSTIELGEYAIRLTHG